jgi:hypothetical protein
MKVVAYVKDSKGGGVEVASHDGRPGSPPLVSITHGGAVLIVEADVLHDAIHRARIDGRHEDNAYF